MAQAATRKPAAKAKPASPAALSKRASIVLAACTAVTLALFLIPHARLVAYPLVLISTVVHEMGHGLAAALSGGHWYEFRMFGDGSGYAVTASEPGMAQAFVCAGGLCGPAVAAAVFLALGRRPTWARYCLGATGGFFALSLPLWVRGGFGIAFIAVLAAVCLVIAIKASAELAQIALLFLATQLALSVYSRGDYLFTRGAVGEMNGTKAVSPSDVEQMARSIGLPYWFWGLLCAAFSAAVLLAAVWLYVRGATSERRVADVTPRRR